MRIEELGAAHAEGFFKYLEAMGQEPSAILPAGTRGDRLDFKRFLKTIEKQRLDWRPGPGKVSQTYYAMIDEAGEFSALSLMRFPLDAVTEVDGGNLLCEVPPPWRGRGHGSVCLSRLLFEAVRAGLRRVLVTCAADDLAARRVIEKNRGELQDQIPSTRKDRKGLAVVRYWIYF